MAKPMRSIADDDNYDSRPPALLAAIKAARKEFGWPDTFDPLIVLDRHGNVENCHGATNGVDEQQSVWLENYIFVNRQNEIKN